MNSRGLHRGGGGIVNRKFGVIRPEVVIKNPVVLVSVLLHALDKPSNMLSPLSINENMMTGCENGSGNPEKEMISCRHLAGFVLSAYSGRKEKRFNREGRALNISN